MVLVERLEIVGRDRKQSTKGYESAFYVMRLIERNGPAKMISRGIHLAFCHSRLIALPTLRIRQRRRILVGCCS